MKNDPTFDEYKTRLQTEATPLPECLCEEAIVKLLDEKQLKQNKKKIKVFPRVAAAAAAVAIVAACVWMIPWQKTIHTKPAQPQTNTAQTVAYTPLSLSGRPAALSQFASEADLKAYFKNIAQKRKVDERLDSALGAFRYGRMKDYAIVEDAAGVTMAYEENSAAVASTAQTTGAGNYGKTNIRTETVDEGDVVKNDGRYLYTASAGKFSIIDTQTMACVWQGEPKPEEKNQSYGFSELYVKGDRMIVCGTLYTEMDDVVWSARDTVYPYYYGDTWRTVTFVYDIADRSAPALLRAAVQDGSTESSRLVGDILYTVTTYSVWPDGNDKCSYVPTVNGTVVPCDRIYVQDPKGDCTNYIVLTALDTAHPDTPIETLSLLGGSDCIYCSADTLYVLSRNYESGENAFAYATDIFSFSLGQTPALKAAGTVPGIVEDQYCIDQKGAFLRVTSTDYDYRTDLDVSSLYVLNDALQIVGALQDFAHDEQVKSTRFLGDLAYVVTFRNTDPLFAIDLSDPSKPVILGEVKLPGFSEYLHPISDTLLLGVGYAGDEARADFSCVKLSLFDISDPKAPKEVDTHIIKDAQSDVNFDPKAFVFDSERGVFGLPVTYQVYGADYDWLATNYVYKTFAVKNGKFAAAKAYVRGSVKGYHYEAFFRGTYIGDKVYTLTQSSVLEFDMESCKKLRSLVYDEQKAQESDDGILYEEEKQEENMAQDAEYPTAPRVIMPFDAQSTVAPTLIDETTTVEP